MLALFHKLLAGKRLVALSSICLPQNKVGVPAKHTTTHVCQRWCTRSMKLLLPTAHVVLPLAPKPKDGE